MYGQELKYSRLCNWKGKVVFAIFGETYPGYLMRFFVNRREFTKYTNKKQNLKILEVGSSNGALTFWLSRNNNYFVVGLEYDKTLVLNCQNIYTKINRVNLYFVCADGSEKIPLKSSFDIVFSTHVLEHISNDQSVLINIFNNLRPKGILILQVPYGDPYKSPSKEAIANGHVREGYTESDLRLKLENAGFQIISVTGSIGRIGRFAYWLARGVEKVRIIVNFPILILPITLALIYLEQVAAFLRSREPSFKHWPLIVARRPCES